MIKTTMTIEGMMCGMCESHVCDAIRNSVPSAKKVSASRSKNEATFISEEEIDKDELKAVIDKTGYECKSITSEPYKKKGLFGRK
ncbi:MAG: heavy-metal-associated domain-containing protein [Lachnospiraceae bacterium]|nr:heavy-metal-associated domain-containing protein [Lachnospiraceae bacterium]